MLGEEILFERMRQLINIINQKAALLLDHLINDGTRIGKICTLS